MHSLQEGEASRDANVMSLVDSAALGTAWQRTNSWPDKRALLGTDRRATISRSGEE
jgi:hypothetical protein